MFSVKIFICLVILYGCDAIERECSGCVAISSCPAAVQVATQGDKIINVATCGIDAEQNVKVCCSDLTARLDADNDNDIDTHKNIALLPENCGSTEGRIAGTESAGLYEFPWMAKIYVRTRKRYHPKCAGTIISSKYILTAAYCVSNKELKVRIGEFDTTSTNDCDNNDPSKVCERQHQDITAEKIISHEGAQSSGVIRNNIALIRLSQPIVFSSSARIIAPICLPVTRSLRNVTLGGRTAIIAGWGHTAQQNDFKKLRKVSLPILTDDACRSFYNNLEKQFCAGELNKDSCRGDGGGPLMLDEEYNNSKRVIQYGIVSHGPITCGSSVPSVYTDVKKYMKWILDNIEP